MILKTLLLFLLLGCQLKMRPDPQVPGPQVPDPQVTDPPDDYDKADHRPSINQYSMKSWDDTIPSDVERLILPSGPALLTKELHIEAPEIVADETAIYSFFPFSLRAKKVIGSLSIHLRGQDGAPGSQGVTGIAGRDGQNGLAAQIARSPLCGGISNSEYEFRLRQFEKAFPPGHPEFQALVMCQAQPTNGEPGTSGLPGGAGYAGSLGFDSPTLEVDIVDTSALSFDYSVTPGHGGTGGLGGPGGIGGKGGNAGARDRYHICNAAGPGENGPNGPAGPEGPNGPDGHIGQYCVRLGDKSQGTCR